LLLLRPQLTAVVMRFSNWRQERNEQNEQNAGGESDDEDSFIALWRASRGQTERLTETQCN